MSLLNNLNFEFGELPQGSLANSLLAIGEVDSVRVLNSDDRASVARLTLAPECFLDTSPFVPAPLVPRVLMASGALLVLALVLLALVFWPQPIAQTLRPVFQFVPLPEEVSLSSVPEIIQPTTPNTSVASKPKKPPSQDIIHQNADSIEPAVRLTQSLLSAKDAALQAWQAPDSLPSQLESPHRGTVFDAGLARRLELIEPGRIAVESPANVMTDVNGMQEVIIGDHCFQVSKLDDQAMRGMGTWTRGHCRAPNSQRDKIKIGVLP